jgi:hypothetical protein
MGVQDFVWWVSRIFSSRIFSQDFPGVFRRRPEIPSVVAVRLSSKVVDNGTLRFYIHLALIKDPGSQEEQRK